MVSVASMKNFNIGHQEFMLGPHFLGSGEPGPPGSTTALSSKTLPSLKHYVL